MRFCSNSLVVVQLAKLAGMSQSSNLSVDGECIAQHVELAKRNETRGCVRLTCLCSIQLCSVYCCRLSTITEQTVPEMGRITQWGGLGTICT